MLFCFENTCFLMGINIIENIFIGFLGDTIMVFSSIDFIFKFLPIFLLCYFFVSDKYKNTVLLIASIFFYGYGEPVFVLLIVFSTLVNYGLARKMVTRTGLTHSRRWLIFGIVYNLFFLFLFKYLSFFTENLNILFHYIENMTGIKTLHIPVITLPLPIGISFYTFQVLSYIIDVYRKRIRPENSLIDLGTYICMFPQLIAGPIIIYSDIRDSLKKRTHSLENLEEGTKLFVAGLASKVILADKIGILWHDVQTIGFESISTPLAWLGVFSFSFQIYFDFYGYSLMAKGLGRMLGFQIPNNFILPYMSRTMTEFWRRWHITLGAWFRDYVYIPLGGSRNGIFITIRNLFIVWLLTGLWHGAEWNFILWGLFLLLLILLEKAGLKKVLEAPNIVCRIFSAGYMALVIPLSWMFFAVNSIKDIAIYLNRLFPFNGNILDKMAVNPYDYIEYLKNYGLLFAAGIICSTGLPAYIYHKGSRKYSAVAVLLAVFWLCAYILYNSVNNPFLYFRF